MASATGFSLGEEAAGDGSFQRQESAFRDWVSDDGSTEYPLDLRPISPVRELGLSLGPPLGDRAEAHGA